MADPFLAEIRIVGFNFAPKGWAHCDGSLLTIAQNTALFSLLGTTYGGNGISTFGLPNLQGRVPLHVGQGPGLSSYTLGESGGQAAVTLTTGQLPVHAHGLPAANVPADRSNPTSAVFATPADAAYSSSTTPAAFTHPDTVAAVGGGQPHNNLQPYLVLNFVIAMQGIFPPRN